MLIGMQKDITQFYNSRRSCKRTARKLTSLNDSIGDIIKINNVGTGGWLLLEKTSDNVAVDYTTNYTTIGRQNGTIQFKVALYDPKTSNVGFDGLSYDTSFRDNANNRIKKILEAIRDDISFSKD